MNLSISPENIQKTIDFHGHSCPGLAIGIRVAELCLKELGHNDQSPLVAVCETDMCGIDAIQFLTGCSAGKGNLILKDYGKSVFTFFRRSDGKGFRALLKTDFLDANSTKNMSREEARAANLKQYMQAKLEQLFIVSEPQIRMPRPAKVLNSLICENCNEKIMESRSRRFDSRCLCIPCFENVEQKI